MEREEIIKILNDTLNDIKEEIKEKNSTSSAWNVIVSLYEDAIIKAENNKFFSVNDAPRIYLEFNSDYTTEVFKSLDTVATESEKYFKNILSTYILKNVGANDLDRKVNELMRYTDIFEEFVNYILTGGKFEQENPLLVEGYTVEKLCNTTILNPLGAYNYLIYLRDKPEEALSYLKAGLPVKDVDVFTIELNEENSTNRDRLTKSMQLPNNIRLLSKEEQNKEIAKNITELNEILTKIQCDNSEYELSKRQQATKNNAMHNINSKEYLQAYYEIVDFIENYGDNHNGKVYLTEKQEIYSLINMLYNEIKG